MSEPKELSESKDYCVLFMKLATYETIIPRQTLRNSCGMTFYSYCGMGFPNRFYGSNPFVSSVRLWTVEAEERQMRFAEQNRKLSSQRIFVSEGGK